MKPDAWINPHTGQCIVYRDERQEIGYPQQQPLYSAATIRKWLLEEPSEAMLKAGSHQGSQRYYSDAEVKNIFLDMLDAFEKDQSSPAKKAYEAANPLGGPARMFDAIAERIRSGEDYYAVLADYGVTVEGE